MDEIQENKLIKAICKVTKGNKMFWVDGIMHISKFIGDEWITKEAHKDPSYSGNRYIWKE